VENCLDHLVDYEQV